MASPSQNNDKAATSDDLTPLPPSPKERGEQTPLPVGEGAGSFIEFINISLNYGAAKALSHLNLAIRRAEIHAVVGEHGAGKSSLGMILCGLLKPQNGHILVNGLPYRSLNLQSARKLGIEMVQQQTLSLNPYFSIADNFTLDSRPFYKLWRKKKALQTARDFLKEWDLTHINPALLVNRLGAPDQLFVDILKHLYRCPSLLILDETLEKLTTAHYNAIVAIFQRLKQQGRSILLITHRIDDVYQLADRVSVIKHGEILLSDEVKNIDKINLIKMAYMQVSEQNTDNLNREFHQLLKYNEAILRNLPINLIVTDHENNIRLVNDYCRQSFELEQASFLNRPLAQVVTSPNNEVVDFLNHALSYREEHAFYQAPLRVKQQEIIGNIKTFPIYDGSLFMGTMLTIEDVTEFDQLQKQVVLSEKLASVGMLAAGVAHEINNPLEIIYTYLSFMKYKFRGQELHKALNTLHEQIADISNIVSNLQTFSDRHVENEEVDLNEVIQNMLNLLKYNAKYENIAIHFEPERENILITTNRNEIKQVILNLLKNSFEVMPSGGEIRIITRIFEENGGKHVQMTFQDTGPGIKDANPNNVFLPFYSTKHGKGSNNFGLGLSISYNIIKKHKGTISVQNLEQAGCQFTITLPQAAAN